MTSPLYESSVFINCPFDEPFRPLFEGLVFAIYDCGYIARCSLEVDDASVVRIEKITKLIAGCKFGVHDISRTEPDESTGLPRFNMPFEHLSPGGQNVLVKEVIEQFGPRFCPGGRVVYVGDTAAKWAYFDEKLAGKLGINVDLHGKMPDVMIFMPEKGWLVLIEAVTSHGPVSPKRHVELKAMFGLLKAGLVFVTTFLTRKDLAKYLSDISWETEAWVAEAPDHMVHFNGERFWGPYGVANNSKGVRPPRWSPSASCDRLDIHLANSNSNVKGHYVWDGAYQIEVSCEGAMQNIEWTSND